MLLEAGSFLEMHNFRAHPRHPEIESLFYKVSLVICMPIKIREVLSQWFSNSFHLRQLKYISGSVCWSTPSLPLSSINSFNLKAFINKEKVEGQGQGERLSEGKVIIVWEADWLQMFWGCLQLTCSWHASGSHTPRAEADKSKNS